MIAKPYPHIADVGMVLMTKMDSPTVITSLITPMAFTITSNITPLFPRTFLADLKLIA